jgi:hypothetical protein
VPRGRDTLAKFLAVVFGVVRIDDVPDGRVEVVTGTGTDDLAILRNVNRRVPLADALDQSSCRDNPLPRKSIHVFDNQRHSRTRTAVNTFDEQRAELPAREMFALESVQTFIDQCLNQLQPGTLAVRLHARSGPNTVATTTVRSSNRERARFDER